MFDANHDKDQKTICCSGGGNADNDIGSEGSNEMLKIMIVVMIIVIIMTMVIPRW